jgi:hypothetical protein
MNGVRRNVLIATKAVADFIQNLQLRFRSIPNRTAANLAKTAHYVQLASLKFVVCIGLHQRAGIDDDIV